jgi:hypothetical protein
MRNNLQIYHIVLNQICQWLPEERVTRQRNMALLITGLFLGAAVHMPKIVRKWPVVGKLPSLVNRLRRFLNNPRVVVKEWYRPVAKELVQPFAGGRIRLVVDCTKVGFYFRLLTISIAYRKRTLPLAWSVHRGRKGHIKAEEIIALFDYVAQLLPENSQIWVVGDTGFQSVQLLRWFMRRHWHFVIRQQGRIKVYRAGHDWCKLNHFALDEGETRFVGWVRLTEKHNAGWFWLILHWERGEDEPWYLVSNCSGKLNLIRMYKVRMWVEEMYGDLKGHGFDLEATHLNDVDRISRLVFAACLTFVWLITLGSWVVKRGFRHFVDRKDRRDKSYFRIGWDWIEDCLRLDRPLRLHFKPYP